jgi:O-Antigen ligase
MDVLIILFFLLFSLGYTVFHSTEKAFLNIYLFVLLFLPQIFRGKIPGIPAMSFAQATIVPIFLIFSLSKLAELSFNPRGVWKYSLIDITVAVYVLFCSYSEYLNEGFSMGRNLLANMLSTVFAPYILAKSLIHPKNLSIKFSKRFVFIIFCVIVLSVYEMRFVADPFMGLFSRFFPAQEADVWIALYRYGFVRIRASFVQPIIFSMVIGIALFIHYWLCKNRFWERYFKHLFFVPLRKKTLITIVLLLGMLFTFSRGPWLSTFLGMLFVGIAFSHYKMLSLTIRSVAVISIMTYGYFYFQEVSEVNRELASSGEEATVAYRGEMFQQYFLIAKQRLMWGWGIESWPKVSGLASIDNHYLWIVLQFGVIPVILFAFMLAYTLFRLFKRGLESNPLKSPDPSLAFIFAGILISFTISLTTVFMGLQLEPIFFMLLGWMEGFLLSEPHTHFVDDRKKKSVQKQRILHAPAISS